MFSFQLFDSFPPMMGLSFHNLSHGATNTKGLLQNVIILQQALKVFRLFAGTLCFAGTYWSFYVSASRSRSTMVKRDTERYTASGTRVPSRANTGANSTMGVTVKW